MAKEIPINAVMVYGKLDRLCGEVANVRERLTKVETVLDLHLEDLKNHEKHRSRNNLALIAIIGVALTAINIFV